MNRVSYWLLLVAFGPAAALPPGLAGTWCLRRGAFAARATSSAEAAATCACCDRRATPIVPGPAFAPGLDHACCVPYRTAEPTDAASPEAPAAIAPPAAVRAPLGARRAHATRRGPAASATAARPPPRNPPLLV